MARRRSCSVRRRTHPSAAMGAFIFIALLIAVIFGTDWVQRWWRTTEWKRRARKPERE